MDKSNIPEPGIYHNITAEEYFSWNCFHSSLVPAIMRSPLHLKQELETDEKSKSMVLGSLVDALILDPLQINNFGILPETYINSKGKEMPFNMNSNDCKEEYQLIVDSGRTPIKSSQMKEAQDIEEGVNRKRKAVELLSESKKQVCIVWDNPEFDIRCKARIDALHAQHLIDLKTTKNASPFPFARDIANFGYHVQAALYLDGWKELSDAETVLSWLFIAVENVPPFCCAVYELEQDSIEAGRIRYRMALARYKDYLASDPDLTRGYSDFIEPIKIPNWEIDSAFREGENCDVGI